MKSYKLLTPGPLTTTDTVKEQMLFDHCTWDDDYKEITQKIRSELLALAQVDEEIYTVTLMQGSGTFGVESVLTSVIGTDEKVLFATNGAYGERMVQIAEHAGICYEEYQVPYYELPSAEEIARRLEEDPAITHVAMVHCETTSGILNDIETVGAAVHKAGRTFIVDAMSSFGGIPIPVADWHIDFIISSANKCIQGVPGFSFIISNKEKLIASRGKARSLSLDLYDQWQEMNKDGKWRYTSPTHTVLAFAQAIEELKAEGGVEARYARYTENNKILIEKMAALGIEAYIQNEYQSPIITTFFYPAETELAGHFSFPEMYNYIKERGYAIYPGKVTSADTFRIGNIGEIYADDMERLCEIMEEYLEEKRA